MIAMMATPAKTRWTVAGLVLQGLVNGLVGEQALELSIVAADYGWHDTRAEALGVITLVYLPLTVAFLVCAVGAALRARCVRAAMIGLEVAAVAAGVAALALFVAAAVLALALAAGFLVLLRRRQVAGGRFAALVPPGPGETGQSTSPAR